MKKLLIMFIYSFLSFEVMSFDNLVGKNLICEGKYQVIGYEFLNNNEVIRHASSNSESDYYKNNGLYEITQKFIKLDVEDDIFTREILRKTLELFIGVHLNNSKVGDCIFYSGDINEYFNTHSFD